MFSSKFVLPHILLPTKISKMSALIDKIFLNSIPLEKTESGNVILTFLDNLPQFTF